MGASDQREQNSKYLREQAARPYVSEMVMGVNMIADVADFIDFIIFLMYFVVFSLCGEAAFQSKDWLV